MYSYGPHKLTSNGKFEKINYNSYRRICGHNTKLKFQLLVKYAFSHGQLPCGRYTKFKLQLLFKDAFLHGQLFLRKTTRSASVARVHNSIAPMCYIVERVLSFIYLHQPCFVGRRQKPEQWLGIACGTATSSLSLATWLVAHAFNLGDLFSQLASQFIASRWPVAG